MPLVSAAREGESDGCGDARAASNGERTLGFVVTRASAPTAHRDAARARARNQSTATYSRTRALYLARADARARGVETRRRVFFG